MKNFKERNKTYNEQIFKAFWFQKIKPNWLELCCKGLKYNLWQNDGLGKLDENMADIGDCSVDLLLQVNIPNNYYN